MGLASRREPAVRIRPRPEAVANRAAHLQEPRSDAFEAPRADGEPRHAQAFGNLDVRQMSVSPEDDANECSNPTSLDACGCGMILPPYLIRTLVCSEARTPPRWRRPGRTNYEAASVALSSYSA